MSLTKFDLIKSLFNQCGLSKNQSTNLIESLLELIKSTLESGEDVMINMSFGPYLNVPLSNTELTIDSPYSISSVSPQPDSSNGLLKWSQTPLQLYVESKKTQETPGFEMILLISVLMILLIILKIRKKEE